MTIGHLPDNVDCVKTIDVHNHCNDHDLWPDSTQYKPQFSVFQVLAIQTLCEVLHILFKFFRCAYFTQIFTNFHKYSADYTQILKASCSFDDTQVILEKSKTALPEALLYLFSLSQIVSRLNWLEMDFATTKQILLHVIMMVETVVVV